MRLLRYGRSSRERVVTRVPLLVVGLLIAVVAAVAAGCGSSSGSSPSTTVGSSVAVQSTATAQSTTSPAAATSVVDCQSAAMVVAHLGASGPSGSLVDLAYGPDGAFVDGFARRAPAAVAAQVQRIRDFLDQYGSASSGAGVSSGVMPTVAEAGEINGALNLSSSDLQALRVSIEDVSSWVAGGCTSSSLPANAGGGQAPISAATCTALGNALSDISVGSHPDRAVALDVLPRSYLVDRRVLDGFPAGVPASVAVHLTRLRTFVDRYAAAAQAAGLAPGTDPTGDEESSIIAASNLGSIEQDQLPTSIEGLRRWTGNSCSTSGIPEPQPTTTATVPPPVSTTETTTASRPVTTTGATTTSPTTSSEQAASPAKDCQTLRGVVDDLETIDLGFDYPHDRDFMDSYAIRAPAPISDSVQKIRDFLDRYSDAAQAAGVAPTKDPLPDQAAKIVAAIPHSDIDKAENGKALDTLTVWTENECS